MKLLFILTLFIQSAFAREYFKEKTHFSEGLQISEELFDFIDHLDCPLSLTPCDGPMDINVIEELKNKIINFNNWRKTLSQNIVPEDFKTAEEETLSQTKIALSFDLLLFDSFYKLAFALKNSPKTRELLSTDIKDSQNLLSEIYSYVLNKERWNKIKERIKKLEKFKITKNTDDQEIFFTQYIENSFTRSRILENDFVFRITTQILLKTSLINTNFLTFVSKFIEQMSKLFGNSIGKIQTRDGLLKKLADDKKIIKELSAKLKPLYLLLEKTPQRLTDKFIPGYFGHVAIWLGGYDDLKEIKVTYEGHEIDFLDHPLVTPYLEDLSLGKFVLEALREPGVTLNTLSHFMDIDDLAILSAPEMTNKERGEYLLRAIKQIGKPYDFNFDVETDRAIVCSELAYTVFNHYKWPTDKTMGRYTINPDHIAWRAVDSCFTPIELYLDGKRVKTNLKENLEKALLRPGGIEYTKRGFCPL